MTRFRVIGIDPALTNVGLCVLESSKPGDYRVTAADTVTPKPKQPTLERLDYLRLCTRIWLRQNETIVLNERLGIAVENPTSNAGTAARTKRQHPQSIGVTGQAVGIVLSVALEYRPHWPVAFITPDEWMPKVRMARGNLSHIMPHSEIVRYLDSVIKLPAGCSEHVVMAAGVARFWVEQERMKARLSA